MSHRPPGFTKASHDLDFQQMRDGLSRACYSKSKGSFLATIRTESLPSLAIEGAWGKSFTVLNLQILTPLGEDIAQIALTPLGPEMAFVEAAVSQKEDLKILLDLLSELGPENLRMFTCGLHAFGSVDALVSKRVPQENSAGLSPPPSPEYFTHSALGTRSAVITVDTLIKMSQLGQVTSLEADSKLLSGWVFSSEVAKVHWSGEYSADSFLPSRLDLVANGSSVTLVFSEFD